MGDWDLEKKKAFTKVMGKKKPSFARGGLIKRIGNLKYFDQGGTALSGPQTVGANSSQTVNNHGLTGTIGNLLGMNNQYQAQGANIQYGTNADQLNNAYTGAQSALNQQQALADSLQAQGAQGMGTQSALTAQLQGIINGTGPNAAQAALNQNTANNVSNQAALMAGQRGASGNVGLMARQNAQQGSGIQQQAVGQAATLQAQQQIAAQQQLQQLAQSQIGQQAGAIQGINNAQQNEQNILQGANTAANSAAVTMQGNINNVNSQVAAGNQQQSNNILGTVLGGASSILGFEHGGQVPHLAEGGGLTVTPVGSAANIGPWINSSATGSSASIAAPSSLPAPTLPIYQKKKAEKKEEPSNPDITNPELNYASSANHYGADPNATGPYGSTPLTEPDPGSQFQGSSPSLMGSQDSSSQGPKLLDNDSVLGEAHGGEIHLDSGGWLNSTPAQDHSVSSQSSSSSGGKGGGGLLGAAASILPAVLAYQGGQIPAEHFDNHFKNYFEGGETKKVPAMVSPGEIYLSPDKVREVIHEGKDPLKIGEKIGGKAKVKNDSLKNDTVSKTLEEGGVVIPRHITTHKMAKDKAALFVHRAVAKKKVRG